MKYDPDRHHRRSIRLKGYDYARPGAYFITLCTRNRECSLGEIVDSEMILSPAGVIVSDTWDTMQRQFPNIGLDTFVIMPNHIHGIITITGDGDSADERLDGCMGSSSSKGLINQTLTSRPAADATLTSRPAADATLTSRPAADATLTSRPAADRSLAVTGRAGRPATHYPLGDLNLPPEREATDWIMMKNDALILGKIVRYLKARTTKMIHDHVSDTFGWQRNYYEHIIRSEDELARIRTYIISNPARWKTDQLYCM